MPCRPALLALVACLVLPSARAGEPRDLLATALSKWSADLESWSFVQHVYEYRGEDLREVRTERFDPTQPDSRRWQLVSINHRAPTAEECRAFDARKNAKPRRRIATPLQYVDFAAVRVVAEGETTITFEVPLRSDVSVFIPFEAIAARVEIDRENIAIKRLEIGLQREMRIAFGLARVTHLAMQFQLDTYPPPHAAAPHPAGEQPRAQAAATLTKLGRRVEISWSDFARVGS